MPGKGGRLWRSAHVALARLREFYREPLAVFWVYGFPLVVMTTLGVAFRDRPVERLPIGVAAEPGRPWPRAVERLARDPRLPLVHGVLPELQRAFVQGKVSALVSVAADGQVVLHYDPHRPDSVLARAAIEALWTHPTWRVEVINVPGGRYIDFLIPGLLAFGLMGGGLVGVGYVLVDMRLKGQLKRYLASPLRPGELVLGVMLSRVVFLVPEVLLLLAVAWLAFGVAVAGSLVSLSVVLLVGAGEFMAWGLLIGSRARNLETVTGLVNLLMLPQSALCGVFFAQELLPEVVQSWLGWLPLTPVVAALRGIIQEGTSLFDLGPHLLAMLGWTLVAGWLGLRWFRWR